MGKIEAALRDAVCVRGGPAWDRVEQLLFDPQQNWAFRSSQHREVAAPIYLDETMQPLSRRLVRAIEIAQRLGI